MINASNKQHKVKKWSAMCVIDIQIYATKINKAFIYLCAIDCKYSFAINDTGS